MSKGWCKDENDFSFAECYGNKLYTHLSGAKDRRKASESALRNAVGRINADLLKSVLRHTEYIRHGVTIRKPI